MNETLLSLACLYYEVKKGFYRLDSTEYCNAMGEISCMARSLGFTLNDIAQVVIV